MFSESTPGLQIAWDNTSISAFKTCPQLYKYQIIDGWRLKGPTPALTWGLAFHDGIEVYEKAIADGASRQVALRAMVRKAYAASEAPFGVDTSRTRVTLLRSLVWYTETYATDPIKTYKFSNGRVGLELSFRFEMTFSPQGENSPYVYCGHIDKLGEYSGSLWAVERKTTKSSLAEHFWNRYQLSAQIGGYVYAGKVVFDQQVSGAILDATSVAVNATRFSRRTIHRVNEQLEEWMESIHYWIRQAENSAKHDYWPQNTESCAKYGECPFLRVCSKNQSIRPMILLADFEKKPWNPLANRGED